ncbi:hypothetical protein ACX3O0_14545 [Homoserinimonas sp. A447]
MRRRAVASVAVAALVLLGTSACNFVAPQATLDVYAASDGTAATIGDVKVLNAMLFTETGEEANLVASVVNSSTSRVQLKLQYESGSEKIDKKFTIGAGEVQNLGGSGLDLVLENIDAKPGDLFPIYLQYGDAEGKQLLVPVLAGGMDHYADLLP